MYHNFFIHSSVDGHLGCFHILAIVNSAAMKNEIQCIFFNFGFLGVGLLGHMVVLFLVLKNLHSVSHSGCKCIFTFPPTVQECSLFSTPSPAVIVCRIFDDDHSDWGEVISHYSFNLHFSNNEQCWASFHAFVQFSSVAHSCLTQQPMDYRTQASWSLLKLTSIESVMPFNHLILCRPLLLLPLIPPSISLFQWVNSWHEVAKVLEFQL